MKKFTFLVAALCATMMASATVFEKVTTAPADWSGQYLIVYENSATEAYVFNGQDAANGYVSATIAAGKIESTELDNYVATIAPMTNGYSVKIAGKYYGGKSGSNSLAIGSTAVLNTLSMKADTVLLTSNTSVMRFNNAKDQNRFRYFKASSYTVQRGICLYKATTDVEEPVIEEISVSKALELIKALAEGASTPIEYIVKGVVSSIDTPNDTIAKYKNCDFWMSDIDAPASKVMAFRTKGIDGADFTAGLIAVGDTVKVQGTLKNFKNSKTSEIIPEINKGNLVEVVAGEGGEGGEEGGEAIVLDVNYAEATYYEELGEEGAENFSIDFMYYNAEEDSVHAPYVSFDIYSASATAISGSYSVANATIGTKYSYVVLTDAELVAEADGFDITDATLTLAYVEQEETEDGDIVYLYDAAANFTANGKKYAIKAQVPLMAYQAVDTNEDGYYDSGVAYELIEEATAIRTVEIDNTVYARDGRIYAEEGARIYSLTGLDVTRMNGNLEGIYIVKNGNKVAKVAVAK